jgi:hypothetical protein
MMGPDLRSQVNVHPRQVLAFILLKSFIVNFHLYAISSNFDSGFCYVMFDSCCVLSENTLLRQFA